LVLINRITARLQNKQLLQRFAATNTPANAFLISGALDHRDDPRRGVRDLRRLAREAQSQELLAARPECAPRAQESANIFDDGLQPSDA
jgi:hypothetical protein